jgi:hypothetical protein
MLCTKSLLAAVALLALTGLGHRWWAGSQQDAAAVAAAALDKVPRTVGPWRGRDLALHPDEADWARYAGALWRRYEDQESGQVVSLLLVCGRPGPVSVHTPDVCYPGVGYDLLDQPRRVEVAAPALPRPAQLWTARFARPDDPAAPRLRIYWSWRAGANWEAADEPRLAFAPFPALYKLYVVCETSAAGETRGGDASVDFLRQLLPELENTLPDPERAQGER